MTPLSTESIASQQPSAGGPAVPACTACGAPLAADQRYCLECGERSPQTSEFLRSSAPVAASPPSSPPRPPGAPPESGQGPRNNNTVSLLAGVGVLLLAMGVGVLIGRSGGSSKQSQAPVQVVTQAAGAPTGSATAEAAFTSDWPSGTKGYTVQLQTAPVAGTTVAAVAADKTAALGKGAGSVGALKSSEFSSLGGENYVIYSGVYHKRSEAQKALPALAKKFPGAKVVEVSNAPSGASSGGSSSSAEQARKKLAPGVGKSLDKPAPPTVLQGPNSPKGKKAEEESKNIPDVVSTG